MNADSPATKRRFSGCFRGCLILALIGGVLGFIILFPIVQKGAALATASKGCLHAASIVRSLDDYAADHQGAYPVGKSSTEIFQSLLDGHYINDPGILYLPMSGKVKADTNHLKPENVCWDVTYCDGSAPPDGVPLVFSTGYKISYTAGGSALLQKKFSFLQSSDNEYLAYAQKGGFASYSHVSPDGTIPNFVPPVFDPKGKTYRQITPDGELPP